MKTFNLALPTLLATTLLVVLIQPMAAYTVEEILADPELRALFQELLDTGQLPDGLECSDIPVEYLPQLPEGLCDGDECPEDDPECPDPNPTGVTPPPTPWPEPPLSDLPLNCPSPIYPFEYGVPRREELRLNHIEIDPYMENLIMCGQALRGDYLDAAQAKTDAVMMITNRHGKVLNNKSFSVTNSDQDEYFKICLLDDKREFVFSNMQIYDVAASPALKRQGVILKLTYPQLVVAQTKSYGGSGHDYISTAFHLTGNTLLMALRVYSPEYALQGKSDWAILSIDALTLEVNWSSGEGYKEDDTPLRILSDALFVYTFGVEEQPVLVYQPKYFKFSVMMKATGDYIVMLRFVTTMDIYNVAADFTQDKNIVVAMVDQYKFYIAKLSKSIGAEDLLDGDVTKILTRFQQVTTDMTELGGVKVDQQSGMIYAFGGATYEYLHVFDNNLIRFKTHYFTQGTLYNPLSINIHLTKPGE